jgi:hypothetical protein
MVSPAPPGSLTHIPSNRYPKHPAAPSPHRPLKPGSRVHERWPPPRRTPAQNSYSPQSKLPGYFRAELDQSRATHGQASTHALEHIVQGHQNSRHALDILVREVTLTGLLEPVVPLLTPGQHCGGGPAAGLPHMPAQRQWTGRTFLRHCRRASSGIRQGRFFELIDSSSYSILYSI